jgi:serine/threonine protein kinase
MTGRVPFPIKKGKALSLQALFLLGNAHKTQVPDSIYELRKASYEAANPGKTYERDYPQWLEDLVMKCLEKKPEDRFKNGKELYDFAIAHMEQDRSGALLEAIENLKTENADLKAENEALKAENAGLKAENQALRAEMAAHKPEEEHMEITDSSDDSHSDSDSQSDTSDDTGGKAGRGWLWWLLAGLVIVVCIAAKEFFGLYSNHSSRVVIGVFVAVA